MTPVCKIRSHWLPFIMLLLCMSGASAVQAADAFDREINFHIGASSLSAALLEFSTQSGVQVAVADSDASHLNSGAVNGVYSVHQALSMLLQGTGLEFTRVGTDTVAIRIPPNGPNVVVNTASGTGSGSGSTAAVAAPAAAPSGVSTAGSQFPDIAVATPPRPSDAELAGDSVYQFIVHHATVHYVNTGVTGSLTRWRGGRPETICPQTIGLTPAYNAFVTARLREVASKVGAPLQPDPACKVNVYILFTTDPDKAMSAILAGAAKSLGVRYPHQMEKELAVSAGHPVQGWYMTTDGGQAILNRDVSDLGFVNLVPLWPRVITTGLTRNPGFGGIVSVILLIDTRKVAGISIGAIADYAATATLTLAESPENCDPLPSILDLMSNCGREKPTAITAGDLAFLRALYLRPGIEPTLTREEIQRNMMQQFKGQ